MSNVIVQPEFNRTDAMLDYYFFLDETGDHGLTYIDKNFPLFLLCGCVFSKDTLLKTETEINRFKQKYFKTKEVILHSREIRKCEGPFQILFDLELKAAFYRDLNAIIEKAEFNIISAAVQKQKHIKKYGKSAKNPYSISLSFILERLIFYLDGIGAECNVEILVEERGRKEDQALLAHFNSILDLGTYYVSPARFKKLISKLSFQSKRDNIIGLQVSDLCAYPLARHILNPKEPYIPFDIIDNKIYRSKGGQTTGWGLKIFP